MDWDFKQISKKDPYYGYRFGILTGKDKADFASVQHIFASQIEIRQVWVIGSQGVSFRCNGEAGIRENMKGVDIDVVITLPPKLFYGTGFLNVFLFQIKKSIKKKTKLSNEQTL